jgi:hypothetical protein
MHGADRSTGMASVAHPARTGRWAGPGRGIRGPHQPSPRPAGRAPALRRPEVQRRRGRAGRLLHGLRGHAAGHDAAADREMALLGPARRRQHRSGPRHCRDCFAILGPAVSPIRDTQHGRGRRGAFRRGQCLAAGQRRKPPRLRDSDPAQHAAVGNRQRAHPAFAVRHRRRRAQSRAGIGISGAGHGPPARVSPGRGDLRGRARRPPGNGYGRVRPRLDRRPDHRGHDRFRRARRRPAADPCPRGDGQGRDSG